MLTLCYILAFTCGVALIAITPIYLFSRDKYGWRRLKSLYYTLKCVLLKKAPHELHPDLIYWEKGDNLSNSKASRTNDRYHKYWYDEDTKFQGFLENSFVVGKNKDRLVEKLPGDFSMYSNYNAEARKEDIKAAKLRFRLENSGYAKIVEQLQEAHREANEQLKLLKS